VSYQASNLFAHQLSGSVKFSRNATHDENPLPLRCIHGIDGIPIDPLLAERKERFQLQPILHRPDRKIKWERVRGHLLDQLRGPPPRDPNRLDRDEQVEVE